MSKFAILALLMFSDVDHPNTCSNKHERKTLRFM